MTKFGFYRGSVVNNLDPLARHRLQVVVPDATGKAITWAEACFPVGRRLIPKLGVAVWVTYEAGNTDFPIWVGVRSSGQP